MKIEEILKKAIQRIDNLENRVIYLQENINSAAGFAKNDSNDISKLIDLLLPFTPFIGKTTDIITDSDTINQISTTAINYNLKVNDKIKIINFDTGNYLDFVVSTAAAIGDTTIYIDSITPSENLTINSLIFFSIIRDTDHKFEIEH